ncbi:hypothetical protein ACFW2M_12095 [Streptomyces albidoflavus]
MFHLPRPFGSASRRGIADSASDSISSDEISKRHVRPVHMAFLAIPAAPLVSVTPASAPSGLMEIAVYAGVSAAVAGIVAGAGRGIGRMFRTSREA